jgi:hypothetical protein
MVIVAKKKERGEGTKDPHKGGTVKREIINA